MSTVMDKKLADHIAAKAAAYGRMGPPLPLARMPAADRARIDEAVAAYHAHRAAIVAGLRLRRGRFDWEGRTYLLSSDGLDDIVTYDPAPASHVNKRCHTITHEAFRQLCRHNAGRFAGKESCADGPTELRHPRRDARPRPRDGDQPGGPG